MRRAALLLAGALLVHGCAASNGRAETSAKAPKPSFEQAVRGLDAKPGLFTVHDDAAKGRVLVELPAPDPETGISARVIHVPYLRAGLGSNPVGLDRGSNGGSRILRFEVRGDKVAATVENMRYVARSDDPLEQRAVTESFASSTVWAGPVAARADDGRVLVDLSDFLTADHLGIARTLKQAKQGDYKLDAKRSFADPRATLAFPDNIELEATLTFEGAEPGPEVRATAPVPEAVTLTVHHSFVRLPEGGFRQRAYDPRAGIWALPVADYAAPLDRPIEQLVALRYRLEKVNPGPAPSPVKKPIVYYIDPGAPEPVRSALIDGVAWWAKAFEAAGFEDAFRAEPLPAGAHPLDLRYNVVQWVHRQTRGWSYGSPIYDPRTGEIIKGVITLGSQRVRQDRRIFEGLLDAQRSGKGGPDDPVQLSIARLRQLAAHEVGHGLGFSHNMAASSYGRQSVMDYPAPLVTVGSDGRLDLSRAYGVGVGAWDLFATRYLYGEFGDGAAEATALSRLVDEARAQGLVFVSDEHSRPLGAAHPMGSVWDNGPDPVAELERTYAVRRIALSDFGIANVPAGQPVAELREVLVPVYLYHRYQVAAAAKLLGGLRFDYSIAGDGREAAQPVDGASQRRALGVLLQGLDPKFLALPEQVIRLLQPLNLETIGTAPAPRETFAGFAGPMFDEQAAASAAASLVIDALLEPQRLGRLANMAPRDPTIPSVAAVLAAVRGAVFPATADADPRHRVLRQTVQETHVARLMALADDPAAAGAVSAAAETELATIAAQLRARAGGQGLVRRIARFVDRPATPVSPAPPRVDPPPGPPIGSIEGLTEDCWFCEPLR